MSGNNIADAMAILVLDNHRLETELATAQAQIRSLNSQILRSPQTREIVDSLTRSVATLVHTNGRLMQNLEDAEARIKNLETNLRNILGTL